MLDPAPASRKYLSGKGSFGISDLAKVHEVTVLPTGSLVSRHSFSQNSDTVAPRKKP